MDELIEATNDWMNDEHAVDFNTFLDNYRANMRDLEVTTPEPDSLEEEVEIEFDGRDDQMTEAEYWRIVLG